MSAQRVVVTVDRPSPGARGCAVLAAVLLLAFTVAGACFALGLLDDTAATVNRVLAAVVGLTAAALLVAVLAGARRPGTELQLTDTGLTLTDRTGAHELAWPQIAEANIATPDGPKRARGAPSTLRLRPYDAEPLARDPALRERLVLPEPGEDSAFWLTVDLPDAAATEQVREALLRFAPREQEDG